MEPRVANGVGKKDQFCRPSFDNQGAQRERVGTLIESEKKKREKSDEFLLPESN